MHRDCSPPRGAHPGTQPAPGEPPSPGASRRRSWSRADEPCRFDDQRGAPPRQGFGSVAAHGVSGSDLQRIEPWRRRAVTSGGTLLLDGAGVGARRDHAVVPLLLLAVRVAANVECEAEAVDLEAGDVTQVQ